VKMQTFRYSVPDGQGKKINARGRFIRGMASDAPYQVRMDGGQLTRFQTGIAFESPQFFDEVELFNDSGAAQIIEVVISDGYVDDNRLVGQVDISGGIRAAANRTADYGAVTIYTALTPVVSENLARGSVLLQNLGGVSVFVGTDELLTVDNGVELPPGGAMSLTVTTGVWARAVSGQQDVRYLEETL